MSVDGFREVEWNSKGGRRSCRVLVVTRLQRHVNAHASPSRRVYYKVYSRLKLFLPVVKRI